MNAMETLDNIAQRWKDWDAGYKLDWWLRLDPCWQFWSKEMSKRKPKNQTFAFHTIDDDSEKDWSDEEYNC